MFFDKQASNAMVNSMLPPPSLPLDTQQEQVLRQLATTHPNGSILQASSTGFIPSIPQNYSPGSSSYNSPGVLTPTQFNTPYQQVPLSPIIDNRMVQGGYPMNSYKNIQEPTSFYPRALPQGFHNGGYNAAAAAVTKEVNMYSNFASPNFVNPGYQLPTGSVMSVAGRIPSMTELKLLKSPKRLMQQEQLTANRERTIYVSDIDHNVTEEDLARLFSRCGDVVDCRLCGDAHSRMRFAFVEFSTETWRQAIPEALKLNDTPLCGVPIRILRSKTAIVPVKRELLPRSEDEMERCQRTIYVSNIDKRLTETDVKTFFQALSVDNKTAADGRICKVRMLGDNNHNTSIAFIEFFTAQSAIAALNKCQGALMGCLPLRVSPSKTPVRTVEEDRAVREAQRAARMS